MSAATYLVMNKKNIYIDTYGKFVSYYKIINDKLVKLDYKLSCFIL